GYTAVTDGNHGAAVPSQVPPEMALEGMAREIVHRLQTMRRSAGFDIADHIVTYYQGSDYVRQVMTGFASYIRQETLSDDLVAGPASDGAYIESARLNGQDISLGVKRSES
ncbi:MAG: isoleucine--tRNA ligase, partial [Chloroflexi bacterium]|nr:isoleucine--tRNA ligase [Chloroflexota bacterium]